MKEQNKSPNKNLAKNEFITKHKRLILSSNKPSNSIQVSSQFRVCNRKTDQKNQILNKINYFRLNNAAKNIVSVSQEKINKKQKEHEENLKKMKELEKLIEEMNKDNNSLSKEIDNLEKEKENLNKDLNEKDEEEKELNEELEDLKNINEEKNREYLQLMQSNHNQQRNNINNINNHNINNNRQNNNVENNNNIGDEHQSLNELFGRLMRLQGQVLGENNNEGEVQNNNNSGEKSVNNSNVDQIGELDEDLGPSMTFMQIDALPVGKYPKKDIYDEKCILCGFNFCYNDSITKLEQCQHTFHKECLGNFLLDRLASKCPICKISLI
jgi:DNA repair exonuclease SbcCD ATPase subunit